MKIPEHIIKSIQKSSNYNSIAKIENEKIREWLDKNNLYNDTVIDQLIDSIEIGDDPKGFIDYLEFIIK